MGCTRAWALPPTLYAPATAAANRAARSFICSGVLLGALLGRRGQTGWRAPPTPHEAEPGSEAASSRPGPLSHPRRDYLIQGRERIQRQQRVECLDHVVVLNQRHLQRILTDYFAYYHRSRTHLSLAMDCPDPRPARGPEFGKVVECPQVGGLHHRYERRAA